jgi:predicted aldo/keto reductase-like oxidoreductase
MEYRKLGRTGLNVSAIGLGAEHLETRETMEDVLRTAVDAGVNYIDLIVDTRIFGPVVKPYRDKLILAAHWTPSNHPLFQDTDACQRDFESALAHMGDYAEVGMLTLISTEKGWEKAQKPLERLQRFKAQGRIGYIGMSSHFIDWTPVKVVNSGLIDVLMVQINLIGHASEKISALCQSCVAQDVGLVAMKPYHGGTLFSIDGKPTGITPTQCLAYVLSLPVSTTVPGARNVEELRATLHYLEATDEEKKYPSAIANMRHRFVGRCVCCNHCLPCSQSIDIGWLIWLVDQAQGGITDELMRYYSNLQVKASECTECGVCMERCPFDVDVIAKMREAVEIFEAKAG